MEFLSTDTQECPHQVDYLLSENNQDFTEELRLLMEAHDALSFDIPIADVIRAEGKLSGSDSSSDSGIVSPGSCEEDDLLYKDVLVLSPPVVIESSSSIVQTVPSTSLSPINAPQSMKQTKTAEMPSKPEAKIDRNTKNAIAAKLNRQKKKEYVSNLESQVSSLQSENEQLKAWHSKTESLIADLKSEVKYLNNVLANQSTLSTLLHNIPQIDNIKLSSSFVMPDVRKRSLVMSDDRDELLYRSSNSKRPKVDTTAGNSGIAGVCLHVLNNTASLEFCSECSRRHSTTIAV